MSSRDLVLGRIRSALAGSAAAPAVPREYQRAGTLDAAQVLDLFVDRLTDYRAEVSRIRAADLGAELLTALAPSRSVVVPAGLGDGVRETLAGAGITVTVDGEPAPLSATELDRMDAVITRAALAVAVNGSIVLDGGPDQGRRIISLVPDLHVVVLDAAQVVETVPDAIARLTPEWPTTIIAGPSATSDIELDRVEGVHGPRTLRVLLVE